MYPSVCIKDETNGYSSHCCSELAVRKGGGDFKVMDELKIKMHTHKIVFSLALTLQGSTLQIN